MGWMTSYAVVVMLLFPAGQEPENLWREAVPAAVARAEQAGTVEAYTKALEVTWRADDWQAGLKLARAAQRAHGGEPSLAGRIARSLWRAGQLEAAEAVIDAISPKTRDRVALTSTIEIQLARGRYPEAYAAAQRLEDLGPETAVEYFQVLAARMADNRFAGVAPMLRKAADLVNVENGYPELWEGNMIRCREMLMHSFTATRMLREYLEMLYL